ncbi:hypothetical protein [Burkholderia ubonensis]|uniref:hypothetical protein n=1 Tax=Burkholderia ubonensis TaxID=101571 RepID=UPI000AD2D2D5|nr:hypothetical protein [Burkholderia ubonensis]
MSYTPEANAAGLPPPQENVPRTTSTTSRKLKAALGWYGVVTSALVLAVAILSSLILIMNRLSGEIDTLVKENNLAALEMHNELQEYVLTIRDSKSGVAGTENRLVNSASVLRMKEHLQKFAVNNRQLYTDIKYLYRVWHPFSVIIPSDSAATYADENDTHATTDYTDLNLYAHGCKNHHDLSYALLTPPEFMLGYITPAPASKQSSSDVIGENFFWISYPRTISWMCDKDSVRGALEVTLPLLRVGSVNDIDILGPPIPEFDVQEGFSKMAVYQDIRAIALILRNEVATFANTVSGFMLPILYALLGASARIFRELRRKSPNSTSGDASGNIPGAGQFVTASIIGSVIGLFTNLLHGGVEFPPLAIAFIAGYASDAFFDFIDRIVKTVIPGDKP